MKTIQIDIREPRTPSDKRTSEYKRMKKKVRECADIRESEYGVWANLSFNHITLFTTFNLN